MIVWGGVSESGGAAYDLENDSWAPLNNNNEPAASLGHGSIWTGSRMAIWGGSEEQDAGSQGSGALYDPVAKTWETIQTDAKTPWGGAGWPEDGERAVELLWTGSKLLALPINSFDPLSGRWVHPGGIYDPVSRTWETITTTSAPNARPYLAAFTRDGRLFAGGSMGNNFGGLIYDFGRRSWSRIMSSATGSFQGRQGTWAPQRDEIFVFGGMYANTPSEFSGRRNGNRGLRLQFNTPIFASLAIHEFNSATGRLRRSTTLNARQAAAIRSAETEFGSDLDGDGTIGQPST